MDGDRTHGGSTAERDAPDASGLPPTVQRVAPAAPPTSSGFANVQMRPEGQRYGDADLVPGGRLDPRGGGGMLMNERNFPHPVTGDPRVDSFSAYGTPPGFGTADGYARFDPTFPGQRRPPGFSGGGVGGLGAAPCMPGEPDDDNFLPPGGRPGEPFGGRGRGQFGPAGGGGAWGGPGGGGSPWA